MKTEGFQFPRQEILCQQTTRPFQNLTYPSLLKLLLAKIPPSDENRRFSQIKK